MKRCLAVVVLLLGCSSLVDSARPIALDVGQIHKAATNAQSLFLGDAGRIKAVDTFLRLVRIKGPSGQEQPVQEEVQRILSRAGAVVVPAKSNNSEAPCNLIMEIPGSGVLASRPGILLNAHVDTIGRSTPEFLAFDDSSGISTTCTKPIPKSPLHSAGTTGPLWP